MEKKDRQLLWITAFAIGLFLAQSFPAGAQDDPWHEPSIGILSITPGPRTSPFDPPTKDAFVTDGGPGLDTGCTFNTSPNHPLIIDIMVDRHVGAVDANGFLVNPAPLIAKGIIPVSIEVIMPAWDVDVHGPAPPEVNEVLFNGENLGTLNGDNNIWLLNSFTVSIDKVKFPAAPPPGGTPTPVANRVQINVDILSTGRWCTAIDWVALIIPIRPEFGLDVVVVAGNQIRRNTGSNTIDSIYVQSVDADCDVTVDIGPFDEFPFSGPSNGIARLHSKLRPCPPGSVVDPEVKVEWKISGTSLQGVQKWTGLEGDVNVTMPNEVGTHTVDFTYTIDDGKTISISRKLFVTKNAPLAKVNPPRRVWYERAVPWGSGESNEDDILQKLLAELYAFGGGNWRYGYNFTPGVTKCTWQQLVADPITCDYTDCFVFSDVFDNMAATLGIGGLAPITPLGSLGLGFVTTGAPSLDTAFPGNARPLGVAAFDRYLFSSHSLRRKGAGTYYDATFNGIYASQTAFIAWNMDGGTGVDADGFFRTTVEGAKVYPRPGHAYDSWGSNKYAPPAGPKIVLASATPMSAHDIGFTGNASFSAADDDSDGLSEALVAAVEVEVVTAGEYTVFGILQKAGQLIANRPAFESMLPSQAVLAAAPGIHQVSLRFSGEQIFQSGVDGPYDLVLFAVGAASHAKETLPTPPLDHTTFGEFAAALTTVADAAVDTNADGAFDFVEATVGLDVRVAGSFGLQGDLSKAGVSLVSASDVFTLSPGTHALSLRFSGQALRRSGEDGPYDGVVTLIAADGSTLGGLEFTTQAHSSGSFGSLLEPDGSLNEQGIDTNGNGLFDILRIQFGAALRDAGDYLVSGGLKNPSEPLVVYADEVMTLPAGPQTLTLDFSGPLIREQAIDGPYQVEVVLRDPVTFVELDRVTLTPLTSAYLHTQFDPLTSADIVLGGSTDQGIDTDGNGLFDHLRVDVEVALARSDFYHWSARLVDVNGREIDFSVRSGTLGAGAATIDFVFDGEKIGQNGADGPYFVKGLLIFGQTGPNLVATDVAQTQAYAVTQFEGAVLPPDCSAARPSVDTIWPPNRKMVDVEILDVTDPQGRPVTVTITRITQDEPLNDTGAGHFEPDGGGVGTSVAQVRAERAGTGNGRVYEISFVAENDLGGTCEGSVKVVVPHNMGKGAVDDGQVYDSTTPSAAKQAAPASYGVSQNTPNPFNASTHIAYQLPEAGEVSLVIYNIAGQPVRTLVQGTQGAGSYRVTWDGRDEHGREVSSGIYIYRFISRGLAETKRMLLVK